MGSSYLRLAQLTHLSWFSDMNAEIVTQVKDNNTRGPECWNQVLEWYQMCLDHHTECRLAGSDKDNPTVLGDVETHDHEHPDNYYPTRLLDLGIDDNEHVRLCISAHENLNDPYATLSHCWCDAHNLKVTTSTLASFQQRISISCLPKTFAEGIEVARRLKIRYLWIDSLYILQDSPQD
jgi:hypothetical protein